MFCLGSVQVRSLQVFLFKYSGAPALIFSEFLLLSHSFFLCTLSCQVAQFLTCPLANFCGISACVSLYPPGSPSFLSKTCPLYLPFSVTSWRHSQPFWWGLQKCLLWCFAVVVFHICFWTSYLSYYTFKTSAFQSHYKKAEEHLLCFYKQSVSKLLGWPKSWGH